MKIVLTVLAAGILTDNLLFSKLIGVEEKSIGILSVLKRCAAVSAVAFLSCAALYPFRTFVLEHFNLGVFSALAAAVFVGIIFGVVSLISRLFIKPVFEYLKSEFYPLIVSSLLVVTGLIDIGNSVVTGYLTALIYFLASLIGFTLASVMLYIIPSHLDKEAIPKAVRGLPLILIIVALFSMALGSLA